MESAQPWNLPQPPPKQMTEVKPAEMRQPTSASADVRPPTTTPARSGNKQFPLTGWAMLWLGWLSVFASAFILIIGAGQPKGPAGGFLAFFIASASTLVAGVMLIGLGYALGYLAQAASAITELNSKVKRF